MNFANRLLLVSTESAPQDPPPPAYPPCYLSQILRAYLQHYRSGEQSAGFQSVSVHPLQAGVNLEALWQQVNVPETRWVLVEAHESLASPLYADTTVADLAWDWRLATILLVPLTPHTISQTIAYTALARQSRCHLKGILYVAPNSQAWDDRFELAPPHFLQTFTQLPILGMLPPWPEQASSKDLAQLAANLHLEYFFPCWSPPAALSA
ncbi:MAG: AAA family ATPase [Prochlorotrichaceae cyanobacterium]|jgi:hypothetical protein